MPQHVLQVVQCPNFHTQGLEGVELGALGATHGAPHTPHELPPHDGADVQGWGLLLGVQPADAQQLGQELLSVLLAPRSQGWGHLAQVRHDVMWGVGAAHPDFPGPQEDGAQVAVDAEEPRAAAPAGNKHVPPHTTTCSCN
jgi:hypothetical protein